MHVGPAFPHLTAISSAGTTVTAVTEPAVHLQLTPGRILDAVVQGFTADGRVQMRAGDVSFSAVPLGVSLSPGMAVCLAVSQVEPHLILRILPDWIAGPHVAEHPSGSDPYDAAGGNGLEQWVGFARRFLETAAGRITTLAEHVDFIRAALSLQTMVRRAPRKSRDTCPARPHGATDFLKDDLLRVLDDRTGTRRGTSTHQSFMLDSGLSGEPTVRLHLFREEDDEKAAHDRPGICTILLSVRTQMLGTVQALLSGDDSKGNISFRVDSENVRVRLTEHFSLLQEIVPRWRIAGLTCTVDNQDDRRRAIRHAVAALAAVRPVDMRL